MINIFYYWFNSYFFIKCYHILQGTIVWFIPTTICAVVAICAGTLVMLLPETKGKDLHDKINEADIVVAGSNNVNESTG